MITAKDIIDLLKEINSKADFEHLETDKKILDQGFDSLDLSRLLFEVEEKFNLTIPDEDYNISDWDTINKIAEKCRT